MAGLGGRLAVAALVTGLVITMTGTPVAATGSDPAWRPGVTAATEVPDDGGDVAPVAADPDADRAAPAGDRPRRRGFALVAQVFLRGGPVRGARVVVATLSGRRLPLAPGSHRHTDARGSVILDVAAPMPSRFIVTATGGRVDGGETTPGTVSALARRGDTLTRVNMGTTLLVDYLALHPGQPLGRALQRLARFLRLPTLVAGSSRLDQFASFTHHEFVDHDPARWYRRAERHGGVARYVRHQAARVRPGARIRPPLRPVGYQVETYGDGGTVIESSARWEGSVPADRRGQRGLIGDAIGGFKSLMVWGLGNLAQTEACTLTHSNLAQAFLACPASSNAGQITQELQQMDATLNSVYSGVQSLQKTVDSTSLNQLITDLNLTQLYSAVTAIAKQATALDAFESAGLAQTVADLTAPSPYAGTDQNTDFTLPAPLASDAVCAPVTGTDTDGNAYFLLPTYGTNASGQDVCYDPTTGKGVPGSSLVTPASAVCAAAYSSITQESGSQAETADNACNSIATTLFSAINDADDMADALDTLYQGFAGVGETDPDDLLVTQAQQDLYFHGSALLSGQNQNLMNQAFAGLVQVQMSAFQSLLAWQSFFETWLVGVPQNCYVLNNDPTVATGDAPTGFDTSCDIAQTANLQLSVERHVAAGGPRASLPNLATPRTPASQQGVGVILDTVASQTAPPVYWGIALDLSGQTQVLDNAYWPYFPYGSPPPAAGSSPTQGYNQTVQQPPMTFDPMVARPILMAYPDDDFLWVGPTQLTQLVNDAWNSHGGTMSSVNAALTASGFQGPGVGNTMYWNYLSTNVSTFSFWTPYAYPGTSSLPASSTLERNGGSCATWPTTGGYSCTPNVAMAGWNDPRIPAPVGVSVTGTWATSYFNTPGNALSPQACPTVYTQATDGMSVDPVTGPIQVTTTVGTACVGPADSGVDGSFYGLIGDTNPGTTLWAQAMIPCATAGCLPLPGQITSVGYVSQWPTATVTTATPSGQTITVTGSGSAGWVGTDPNQTFGTLTPQCAYWPASGTAPNQPATVAGQVSSVSGSTVTYSCVIDGLAPNSWYNVAMAPAQAPFAVGATTVPAITVFSDSQQVKTGAATGTATATPSGG